MIEVRQKIEIYEVDGEKVGLKVDEPRLQVNSHSSRKNWVVLVLGGVDIAVLGSDLRTAITNATSTE
ncbi:hypothetical protein LCGC14_1235420 [marine sediment metagenome]|uniref:Uncharacterized protein n=1 Tax=marine sediment metagenome TaxID=412755 RepID=A0A0F9LBH5_9ZZZZ